MRKGELYPEEVERLRAAYIEMQERKSTQTGSAMGEHYILAGMLREFGITDSFESSSQVENYVEHLLTYNEKPDLY